ncbi:hypothetical protein TNCV_5061871 [Trichonephila clavipes]|nr:hypothetical protein TNCV_5061871 [Trichonephila clavipes]
MLFSEDAFQAAVNGESSQCERVVETVGELSHVGVELERDPSKGNVFFVSKTKLYDPFSFIAVTGSVNLNMLQ